MLLLFVCFFLGVVTGAGIYAVARHYRGVSAQKIWPMRARYRRYEMSRHLRYLRGRRRYRASQRRISRLLDRLARFEDSDL